MKFTKQTVYISLFAILYLIVAFSSFWHACAFFGLANNSWMSIILAFAFEIGQAAVLFSLLTSKKDRSRVMPWVLMTMFTLVQVIGNVFSSYKYIISNSVENLRFFKEPIFIWTTLPDDQATVIVTYVVGAILPIAALLLTSMITNYLSDKEEEKSQLPPLMDNNNLEKLNQAIEDAPKEELITEESEKSELDKKDEEIEELKKQLKLHEENPLINEHSILQMEKQGLEESNQKKDEEIEQLKKQLEDLKNPQIQQIPSLEIHKPIPFSEPEGLKNIKEKNDDTGEISENDNKETTQDGIERPEIHEEQKEGLIKQPSEEDLKQAEALISGGTKSKPKKESHFIN